jgi:3-carboxy-cis,cis-muconate cycloisomerase
MSLYSQYFYCETVNQMFGEEQTLSEMLRFEAELANAQAEAGFMPKEAAELINDCCLVQYIDINKLKSEINLGGNAAIPLVKQLTKIVKNRSVEASKYVHLGATSQDVIDTATMLQLKNYLIWLQEQMQIIMQLLVDLTNIHRNTPMVGRTLLQQAKPITFGLKTAHWLHSLLNHYLQITHCQDKLCVQLGGAVGSGNLYINNTIRYQIAKALGLKNCPPWHTNRAVLSEIASTLALCNQSLAKIAKDISLLMQTEIGEVCESAAIGKGGSSTMPHKRNPVACTAILANATRMPQLIATMFATMPQENERSAGLWHAEWEVLSQIIVLHAGTVSKAIELLSGLEVNQKQMLYNLEQTKGLIYAENVVFSLSKSLGKIPAQELVEKACKLAILQEKHLKDILLEQHLILPDSELLFDASASVGYSTSIIDEILSEYEVILKR